MARKTKPTIAPSSILPSIGPEKAQARLRRLLEQIPQLRSNRDESAPLTTWVQDIQGVLSNYYGRPSLQLEQFDRIRYAPSAFYSGMPDSDFAEAHLDRLAKAEGFVRSRIAEIEEDLQDLPSQQFISKSQKDGRKVFVVHGHDHGSKETIARYLTKLGLQPVVLHEQPDQGRTIIEKFEHYADVACALVILSPDDFGSSKSNPFLQEQRARQNVIFEMGFFIGRLGRTHTFALLQTGVVRSSDIDGVLYISMDNEAWKLQLVKELKAAGMEVDANKAFD